MTLETLYKRTKKGDIQQWSVSSYDYNVPGVQDAGAAVVKHSGRFGGKLTPHEEKITKGKNIGKANETTPYEQAQTQALSDWNKKHDEGYKSLENLGIEVHETDEGLVYLVDSLSAAYKEANLEKALDKVLPQFNTDASGELKPQLAPTKPWKHGAKKNKYPKIVDYKKDGLRSHMVMTPEETYVLSRSGKRYDTMYRLTNVLDAVFPKHLRTQKTIIDGELYKHGMLLEEINEAVKKESENTWQIEFHAFDLPLVDEEQEVRSAMTEQLVNSMIDNPLFVFCEYTLVYDDDQMLELHDKVTKEDNYEGLMSKDPEGTYCPGQRNSDWEKVKMFDETEFIIVGYKLGQRGSQDLNFICLCNDGKDTFEAPMNGTIGLKARLYEKIDELIGKDLTVKHFGYSKYNIPNLPKGKAIREPGT